MREKWTYARAWKMVMMACRVKSSGNADLQSIIQIIGTKERVSRRVALTSIW